MSAPSIRVLGIDTSLRSTGVAVVEAMGSRLTLVDYAVLTVPARARLSACLLRLQTGLADMVSRCDPQAAAIEEAFFAKNARTAMILGQARGVAIAACAARKIPVFEYAARRVKQAVVGFGAASKEQVQSMVVRQLSLTATPPEDASDAIAVAICHLHNRTGCAALMPEAI
jgi:crossover junction endodeoxyribonuclease RuvC